MFAHEFGGDLLRPRGMYFIDVAACTDNYKSLALDHNGGALDSTDELVFEDVDHKTIPQGPCRSQECDVTGMKQVSNHSCIDNPMNRARFTD